MDSRRNYRQRKYEFSKQVVQLRIRLALTQSQLAEQIGVHWHSVQKWETGESYPKAETLQRLIVVLLRHQAFTSGSEREEAHTLWQHVSEDGQRRFAAFDDAWFARLIAEHSPTPAPVHASITLFVPDNGLDKILSQGLVTFLASDIESSTQRWEHFPQAMQQALARHHAIFYQLTELYKGHVLHTAGDSFVCAFADAATALQSALALQRALLAEPWPEVVAPLRVRMALHSGAATIQGERYVAEPTLNRLSRVLVLSQGGQILLTQATSDLIGARWPEGVTRHDLGVQQLRDVTVPLQIWQVLAPDLPPPPTHEQHSTPALSSVHVDRQRSVVDWGEAISVPTLYGRESEFQTLQRWIVDERCRVIAILGLGGIGKSSLAITLAHQVLDQFDVVVFRSLRNGPPLAEGLDRAIRTVSDQQTTPPEQLSDKIARLVELLRERRCLLILDNFESLMQPGAATGTYRTGYAEYGELIRALSEREHQSCLVLTSRERPAELGSLVGYSAPVRLLPLTGLDQLACQRILEAKNITGTATTVSALVRVYGGNPLALQLVSEPIHELFGGNVAAFLAMGDAFFNGVGQLLAQQFGRSTPLEQTILYWLAIERELAPFSALLANLVEAVPQRELLVVLESLRRRMLIEHAPDRPAFTLQPVILEFLTDRLVEAMYHELVDGQPKLLRSHALVQATAKDYVRHSQEQFLLTPLLKQLVLRDGSAGLVAHQLVALLERWRGQPKGEQGYGPANVVHLLRWLRGDLRGINLSRLTLRGVYWQGVEAQDTSLASASVRDNVFTEAFSIIHAIASTPSGSCWAASSVNGAVQLWRDNGHTTYLSIAAHAKQITALAFSPNERILATGSWDCTIKLWDIQNGASLGVLQGHQDYVQDLAFSPDGQLLASGSDDRSIRIWNVSTGTCLKTIAAHTDNAYGVAWSPDGRLVASCGFDHSVRVWEMSSGECVQTFVGHTGPVSKVAFSPDGQLLASGGFDRSLRVWDVANGTCIKCFDEHDGTIMGVAWNPTGNTVATCSYDSTIRLWDLQHDRAQHVLLGHVASINSFAFTSDGKLLLSGSDDQTVRVWDVERGWCVRVIAGYGLFFFAVVWSPDSRSLLSANSDTTLTLWNVTDGSVRLTLRGHTHMVYSVAWSPNGRWLASCSFDQTVRIWDAETGTCVRIIPAHIDTFYRVVSWSPDSRWLASAGRDHVVQIWDIATGSSRWEGRGHTGPINDVVWSPDGRRLASCGEDRTVRLWQAEDGALLHTLTAHETSVANVAWSPDGRRLASCGGGGTIGELFVWDAESSERLKSLVGHNSVVYRVAWSQDSKTLFSGGMTGVVCWWDIESGANLYTWQSHRGWIRSLSVSPNGMKLISSGEDGVIHMWHTKRAELIRTLRIDRPYERMDITGLIGLSEAQRGSLIALGAVEQPINRAPALASAPGHAADQPARGDQKIASNLPSLSTSFVGRDVELAEVARILGDPACRLLTLLGPGGIGKTRLALEVAAHQSHVFADGVAFVALASVGAPSQIVSAIGDALNVSFAGHSDLTTDLLDYLRERHMLLVLDNVEHLLDGTDLISDILQRAPRVTILVTSRERLNLQAEWLFDVDGLVFPLEDPHGSAMQQDLVDYSAIQLFVQRAMQIQPRLSLAELNITIIMRICQHVAGMPLAIELAAAGVRTLSLAEIEQRIHATLDGLASSLRDLPARHRSMRAAFDHSWDLLSESEQVAFSRLAVFRGGWSVEAAEKVAGVMLPVLSALADKSLVRKDKVAPQSTIDRDVPEADFEPRFVLLEPIREYALEQLKVHGEVTMVQHAHASYYLAMAEASAHWDSPTAETAMVQLDRDYDNVRAALQWTCDGGDSILGIQLAGALRKFWQRRGYFSEGRSWLEELLAVDDASGPTATTARARALHTAAWLASDQHDYTRATHLFEQNTALRRALGEAEDETQPLGNAAREARAEGQYQRATALMEEALARNRVEGDRGSLSTYGLGNSLYILGLLFREQGNFAQATTLIEECLQLHQELGDREGITVALLGLSDIARDQADIVQMRACCEQSLAISRDLGLQWASGFALNNLALEAYLEGDLNDAFVLVDESMSIFRDLQADASRAEVLITLGKIVQAQGDNARAYAALSESLRLAQALGPRLMEAAALEGLADVVVSQGYAELGVQLLASASVMRVQMGIPVRPVDQAAVDRALAVARSMLGDTAFAAVWNEAQSLPVEQIVNGLPSVAAFTTVRAQT